MHNVKSVSTRWNSVYHMLDSFREQRKCILAVEYERATDIISCSSSKRSRRETISKDLPSITVEDFEFLNQLCPILKIFDNETKKVVYHYLGF